MTRQYLNLETNDRGPLTKVELSLLEQVAPPWTNVVRLWFPDATEEFATYLLWEHTPWPLVGLRDTTARLAQMAHDGPRCDQPSERGSCSRKVPQWGAACYQHQPSPYAPV